MSARQALVAVVIVLTCVTGCTQADGVHAERGAATGKIYSLSVHGNHLVNQNGDTVRLTGVNRSGAEYACAEGWGIWDGPTDTDAAIQAMIAWHVNAVRIPLNEDCWLGINGIKPAYSGHNYQSQITYPG